MLELDTFQYLVVALAFLAGGLVKGVIGIGLPLVVVPVVATFTTPIAAIALMLVPALSSNVMQARQAGLRRDALQRFWPAVLGVVAGSVLGSSFLSGADSKTATAILGVVVVLFCLSQLFSARAPVGPRAERWFTPLAGSASGLAGGLTGFFGLTLVPYLLSLQLAKEEFVATIAMLYLCGVSALYLNLYLEGALDLPLALTSAAASLPTLAGVWLGSLLRRRVSDRVFRRLLVLMLLLIAVNLLRKSLTGDG
ncbi:MAG: sulfite exporter TauE/SafE family protein [Gammaproteobacteria bacterium]|nr:sulfite exporter TauE/SafE family protein [Gammaproteobacteria bacterium]